MENSQLATETTVDNEGLEKTLLSLSKSAYDQSTTFIDNNYRKQWENNIKHWQSKHASGSKYLTDAYKYRSKIFRPKTRSAIRNKEAAAVAAFFSNQDVTDIKPRNENDPMQKASADINKELLAYRMQYSIPWYQICIGGCQDAMVIGSVVSCEEWEYKETSEGKVISDKPVIRLIPIENIRMSPGASWLDPINSSPYLIELMPMYIMDIKQRMTQGTKKSKPWKKLDDGVLMAATKQNYDSTRTVRDDQREDKNDSKATYNEFSIAWVHRNFIRIGGDDITFYTLGTEYMLSDPEFVDDICPFGERPYSMGHSIIEAHKQNPSGLGQIGEALQKETNENINQRLDNVKFVLNKRWFVKRGSQVDLRSITSNVPGSVTLMNDPTGDVVPQEFNDVTSSAYQEQNYLNADIDELLGTFSASTVSTNRNLNETVGGMQMLRANTNMLTEYDIRTICETWIEKVVRHLVKLEQYYESDEVILAIAAEKAQLYQKYKINDITDKLLRANLTVSVNYGVGGIDPVQRMNNYITGLSAINVIAAMQIPELDKMEMIKEVWALLGYKDGLRFFIQGTDEDPEKQRLNEVIKQYEAIIQQLQQAIETKQTETAGKLKVEQLKSQSAEKREGIKAQKDILMKRLDLMNPVVGEVTGNA